MEFVVFERCSSHFGSQANTKALSIQRRSNCLLSFPQKQFATLIKKNPPSVTQPSDLSLKCVSLINYFAPVVITSVKLPIFQN